MTQQEDAVAELRKIVGSRKFTEDSEQWIVLVKQIPCLINSIIETIYNTEPDTEIVIDPLNPTKKSTIKAYTEKITDRLNQRFGSWPPFTVLRLSEVLIEPMRYYSNAEKFLRALENICWVSSSVNEFERNLDDENTNEVDDGSQGEVVGVTDESQVILLSKIAWLTEKDKEEIQSEGYLSGALAIGNGTFDHYPDEEGLMGDIVEEDDEEEEDEDYVEEEDDSYEDELVRKRKVEKETNPGQANVIKESPEKKFKTEESTETTEWSNGDANVQTNASIDDDDNDNDEINTTLEEDKMKDD